jgi:hypothetical protein
VPFASHPVLDRVLFSAPHFDPAQPRDDHGRFTTVGRFAPENVAGEVPPWTAADRPAGLARAAGEWAAASGPAERRAVANYTTSYGDYKAINGGLRQHAAGGPPPPPEHAATAVALDAAIRRFPRHAEPVTSFRGMSVTDDDKCYEIERGLLAALETGTPVTFDGFTSSSLDPQAALFFAASSGYTSAGPRPVLVLKSPRGAYLDPLSATKNEHEIVHTAGERFRVTGVSDVAYASETGYTKVHRTYTLEAVPEDPPPLNLPAAFGAALGAAFGGDQARDERGRFATGPRPDLHPEAVVSESQGDGVKIQTPHGYIDYRHRPDEGTNEIWWVESHKRGHGSALVDMMQKNHPAASIGWGVTTPDGKGLRDRWHAAHPDVEKQDGAFEGQFDPSGNNYGESESDDETDGLEDLEDLDDFGEGDETRSLFALFAFDPRKHPRDAHGLFAPADGGVVDALPEDPRTRTIEGPPELEAASKAWAEGLTNAELKAVGEYTDDAYIDLNPALRANPDGVGLDPRSKKLTQKLDAAIRKYPPFPSPVTSYRGMSISDDKKLARLDAAFNAALATGEPVTMNGFSSADLDPGRAASRAGDNRPVLEIRSRRGAYIRAASSCKGEHEILHTHGEKFRVVGVKTVKYRMRWGGLLPRKTYVLEAVEDEPEARFAGDLDLGFDPEEPRDERGNGPGHQVGRPPGEN